MAGDPPLRIGILETGVPPADLAERFGRYDAMMARLLGEGIATSAFDVQGGELPHDPAAFDGFVVTGSAAGVYDDLPWIAPLQDFLRRAKGRTRLVGICFGHQVMAEAFGGRVLKSDKGWGVGLHGYEVREQAPWMDDAAPFSIPASHQDQVVEPPPAARVVASSAFVPFAALAYEDQPAISFQGHPEFTPDFAKTLLRMRRDRFAPSLYDQALASLDRPNDNDRVGGWIRAFFRG